MKHLPNFCNLLALALTAIAEIGLAQSPRLIDDPDIASYRIRFKPNIPTSQQESANLGVSKQFVKPQLDVTKKLNQSLDSVYLKNKQIKYAQGYRISVFSGTDKELMNQVKQKVYKLFPEVELYTVFKQPEYRISFGDFIDKIQANNYLARIQVSVSDALIVQDQINIRIKRKQ